MLPRPLLGIALTALLLSAGAGAVLARAGDCGSRDPDRSHACLRATDADMASVGVVPLTSVQPVSATSLPPEPARPPANRPPVAAPPPPAALLAPAGSPLAVLAVCAAGAALAALVGSGLVVRRRLVAGGGAPSGHA
jgi:hypothetical protein